ncbi:ATP-binding protein [Xanthobacteraceae bacterium Astr-EGSB]|uniref:sensor histidine kinase n=1 Tax=Astrobacterium formosum TaxID=3069710 RepID=UPI0027B0F6E5|nr:ATP-binding protein [Xanthobacteraceae bacterium Astr-EGSB]
MSATEHHALGFSTAQLRQSSRSGLISLVRALPIRWRILTIAGVNAAVVLILAGLIWNGAKELSRAWDEVRKVRESDRVLALLEGEAGRLQNLIHRYINQPSPQIFAEILLLREAVLGTLRSRGATDPMLSGSVDTLEHATDRFLAGFGDLRAEQTATTRTYEEQVLAPAREMAGLYAIIDSSVGQRDSLIWPPLGKSREAFAAMLVAANSYYLSIASNAAEEARTNIQTIERTIPVLLDLAENNLQRVALTKLGERSAALRQGLATLAENFARRDHLLHTAIDANQAAMIAAIDELSSRMRAREQRAQTQFDATLADIYRKVVLVALVFGSGTIVFGFVIALSIRQPLRELMAAMQAITSGDYERHIQGTEARDEIGEMARAAEVFRENAIARHKAETELRMSKDRAEKALSDLQAARQDLIDAERLAALGGLVAGIAHEVNNPIGISLTVASSFASRAETFARELKSDTPLRRSRLEEFVAASGDAARQLVGNLQRAGELIQSFKQVAVDRSHAERRQFDLQEATDQIIASLRPALKKSRVDLSVSVPEGLVVDSYPGAYGQVLTNLFLNALTHAFTDGRDGSIDIRAQAVDNRHIEISITDDGAGMAPDVLRQAFDPFFTTRRSEGGTGLGLHIVYNLVTQQLGGRLALSSRPGQGTMFRITLPRSAPREPAAPATTALNG